MIGDLNLSAGRLRFGVKVSTGRFGGDFACTGRTFCFFAVTFGARRWWIERWDVARITIRSSDMVASGRRPLSRFWVSADGLMAWVTE